MHIIVETHTAQLHVTKIKISILLNFQNQVVIGIKFTKVIWHENGCIHMSMGRD